MRLPSTLALFVVLVFVAGVASAQTMIDKPPDLGDFWQPLSPNGGTYVYADCFVAPDSGDLTPTVLGTWMNDQGSGDPPPGARTRPEDPPGSPEASPTVRFEIWGGSQAAGPDAGDVLMSTGSIQPVTNGVLTFVSAPVQGSPAALTPGQVYWFAATVVGESGDGFYNVGGHTQNSVFQDSCTFWFSNDPAGINFDGQNLTPEMAISVTLGGGVPALPPAGILLLMVALAVGAMIALRRIG